MGPHLSTCTLRFLCPPHLATAAEDARQEGGGRDGMNGENKNDPSSHDPTAHPSFRSYFAIVSGHGEVDAQSLENILLLVGISLMLAQVEDILMSRGSLHSEPQIVGPASQQCLGLHVKGPAFGSMLCCHNLEILNNY